MKVRVISNIPVELKKRPIVGNIYEVTRSQDRPREFGGGKVNFINVNGNEVGVLDREVEIINE